MQFYYVKRRCSLVLPHKVAELCPPSQDALRALHIPLQNIYCGNVGWEIVQARLQLGGDGVIIQELTPEIEALLPSRICAWSVGGDVVAQVRSLAGNRVVENRQQPFRIALINGVGTMLGDTLVGSRALEIAVDKLRAAVGAVEIHAVLAWNARPGAEGMLRRSPAVTSLQEHSLTLEQLRGFDAYWDFSTLLRMDGYDTRPLIDFYLEHFAVAPESVGVADKLPVLRLSASERAEAKRVLDRCKNGRKTVLLQGVASTPLRSMPDQFFALLLSDVLNKTDVCIVLTQPLPVGVQIDDPTRVIQLAEWCALKTENFLSLFAEIDVLISVDTLAIHAAMAEKKPGVAIFTTMHPELRLSSASLLKGYLIPGAQDLPFWGCHKEDADWAESRPAYDEAWLMLDRSAILESLCLLLAERLTAAIYYHPEAYTTSGPKLMGRNAAGESFLRGFCSYSKTSAFWVQVQTPEHARLFFAAVQNAGRHEPVKAVESSNLGALAQPGTLYFPGPGIGEHAWQRATMGGVAGHGAWSVCGITHTTSSAGAMDAVTDLLTAPVQPWDALICTSVAVKSNVTSLLQAQADYLVQRLGVQRLVLPQLPVIPLGIHTHDFAYGDSQRCVARQIIGADERSLVVLYTGRLSFHAKAHPLAMYQALEKAAASLSVGQKVVLVECGWHANEFIEKAFEDTARCACPSVRVVILDGRKPEDRQTAWASADVFCSLADNIQETFGIVPIEAMAAGIPVVVSDWDGYKDTVRDGVDGFRIPTLMPGAGLGTDLAQRHALEIDSYDMYCGHSSSLVAVDIEAAAQAFSRLFASPELRQQMGEAGRQRAREVYDWAVIIPQYEALWAQLAEIRKAQAPNLKPLPHPWPARLDPFHAFACYPTTALTLQTVLGLVDSDVQTALQRMVDYRQLAMVNYAEAVLPAVEEVSAILAAAALGAKSAGDLLHAVSPERQAFVFRGLVWLVKLDVMKVYS